MAEHAEDAKWQAMDTTIWCACLCRFNFVYLHTGTRKVNKNASAKRRQRTQMNESETSVENLLNFFSLFFFFFFFSLILNDTFDITNDKTVNLSLNLFSVSSMFSLFRGAIASYSQCHSMKFCTSSRKSQNAINLSNETMYMEWQQKQP